MTLEKAKDLVIDDVGETQGSGVLITGCKSAFVSITGVCRDIEKHISL